MPIPNFNIDINNRGGETELKNDKRKRYRLKASIHTVSVRSDKLLEEIPIEVAKCITTNSRKRDGDIVTSSIINVNKLYGDLYTYNEFQATLDTVTMNAGIDKYKFIRADLRLDSYDENHYKEFAKLNRFLISALAVAYRVSNCYRTLDLFTSEQLSVAIKNRYFECENYDKQSESHGTDSATSRLELRSKCIGTSDLKYEFLSKWFKRLDNILDNLVQVEYKYNEELIKIYNKDIDSFPRQFRNATDFVMKYQYCIFTHRQMVGLFQRMGVENAENRVNTYKKKYGIDFYSPADVRYAVNEIKRAIIDFFDN